MSKREKLFGTGRPQPLDREGKCRVQHLARALAGQRAPGKAYGYHLAPKVLEVLQALLWTFHNAKSGLCWPSYETIAKAAGCARSTVAEAIKALEDARILTWCNRLKRVRDAVTGRSRVIRASNAYQFADPARRSADCSKSGNPTGTRFQVFSPSLAVPAAPEIDVSTDLGTALLRFQAARDRRMQPT
jgi:Helix-turn-helix domain